MVFLACGGVCLARARALAAERTAWSLIGIGFVLYASGSVVYNVELSAGAAVAFPSCADALWLSLYPLSFAGMVALVRARHVQVNASLWIDGVIGGSAVAALAAVFLLPPVVRPGRRARMDERRAARLPTVGPAAHRLRRRPVGSEPLATGHLARARPRVRADRHQRRRLCRRADGGGLAARLAGDIGYVAGSILVAGAAWRSQPRQRGTPNSRVALPIAFTVTSFALVSYEAFVSLNIVAVALIRLTLFAVVLRLGLTLWWLSRQRADLEALAASDPLTGLGNYRAFQEQLAAAVGDGGEGSVIVLDLDHFKALNDTFGHAEGDRVLQATATALSRTVGEAASSRASGARSSRSSCAGSTNAPPPRSRSAAAASWRRSPCRAPRSRARRASPRSPAMPRPCHSCCRPPTARSTGPSARVAIARASMTRTMWSR